MPATSTFQSSGTDRIPSAFSQGSETASLFETRVNEYQNGGALAWD